MPRRPPHFKAFVSIANHDTSGLAAVYQDNRLLALWLRLGLTAIERYADRTGDRFVVGDRELLALSGVGRPDVARTLLERLADVSPMSVERDGDVWRIHWPNFAKKQFSRDGNGTETGPPSTSTSTSTSYVLTPSSKRKEPRESEATGSRAQPPAPPGGDSSDWKDRVTRKANRVFAVYGFPGIRGVNPGSKREGRLRTLLKHQCDGDVEKLETLVAKALHGYVCVNGLSRESESDYVPADHFSLDSVLRPSNLDRNVSAAEAAAELRSTGKRKPFPWVEIPEKLGGGHEPKLKKGDHVPAR